MRLSEATELPSIPFAIKMTILPDLHKAYMERRLVTFTSKIISVRVPFNAITNYGSPS